MKQLERHKKRALYKNYELINTTSITITNVTYYFIIYTFLQKRHLHNYLSGCV